MKKLIVLLLIPSLALAQDLSSEQCKLDKGKLELELDKTKTELTKANEKLTNQDEQTKALAYTQGQIDVFKVACPPIIEAMMKAQDEAKAKQAKGPAKNQ